MREYTVPDHVHYLDAAAATDQGRDYKARLLQGLDLAPYYNVTGISNDGSPTTANFDGDGFSYSEQALTAANLGPGATVTEGGIAYTMPDVAASQPDAVEASGQTIPVTTPSGPARSPGPTAMTAGTPSRSACTALRPRRPRPAEAASP